MSAGPRVLHVAQPTDGGVAAVVAALAADQHARDWPVALACPPDGRLARDVQACGVPVWAWSAARQPGPDLMRVGRSLRRVLRWARPDVVHLHSATAGLVGRLTAPAGLPVIYQPHGWSWLAAPAVLAPLVRGWERAAAIRTDLLVCCGADEAAVAHTAGVSAEVVRNGVDLSAYRPARQAPARVACGIPPTVPLVVCVGRVTRQKGQDVLVSAWPRVREALPTAQLCLIGEGDLLPELARRTAPGVRFVEAVPDPGLWYAAADVVVVPSRWEGLPLVLLEALASGRPVVGHDIPGIREALPDGAGARVRLGDTAALASAITRRLTDELLRRAEGHAARHAALAFDRNRACAELATATLGLLGTPTRITNSTSGITEPRREAA